LISDSTRIHPSLTILTSRTHANDLLLTKIMQCVEPSIGASTPLNPYTFLPLTSRPAAPHSLCRFGVLSDIMDSDIMGNQRIHQISTETPLSLSCRQATEGKARTEAIGKRQRASQGRDKRLGKE
jgi:hypothetical protein